MGNAAPRAQPQSVLDSASQYRTFLMDYTPRSMDMMFGSLIGDGKFLKSISCKCDEGHLVVKIYRKYDERESLTSAEVALRRLALAFSVEQQPNVIPYADFQLSNKYNVAFMVRQYFASNLYDRICSRPFLTMVEKKWIAFQILRALEQSHAKGICHGDIKQENVMVTSWNWVFLTDFAPFKPTYIPEDDPADYNYYFCAIDATRRGCSVAPERFYGKGSASISSAAGGTTGSVGLNSMKTPDAAMMLSKMADSEVSVEEVDKQILAMGLGSGTMSGGIPMQTPPSATSNGSAPSSYSRSRREGSLLESMDIFSAGCVIAELFLGGKPLFDLPSLLKYRTGDSEPLRQQLKKVGDPRLEELLLHMLQLDPNARLSASGYLAKYTSPSGLFPTYFDNFLFRFLVLVLSRGGKVPDARIRLVCKYYGRLVREVAGVEDPEGEEFFKLRLKEGYGSDRLASATGGDQQTHVAQRVLEELELKIPTKHDKQKAERDNAALTKIQKIKEKENDMRGLKNNTLKKKIEKLHDQYNALTQKKKNSLLLDYAREPSTGRLDEETGSEDAKDENGKVSSDASKENVSTPPPHSAKSRRMKPPTYPGSEPWPQDRNGIVIILSLICSSLRHVQVPESKVTALYLIRALGQFTSDEARLQRLIPYLLEVIDDPSATVRALALRTITYLLSLVESFPLADASVFPQYVLPAMVPFQSDPDELVRITFAECLPQLAETSRRFLEIAHAMKQKTLSSSSSASSLASMSTRGNDTSGPTTMYMAASSFDKELSVLHKMISRFVIQLTTPDQKASSSLVKRALLIDITRLCVFFGRERTLDVVLPQLITFLNDPDWELRGAFFDYIVGVCSFVGCVAVEHNILPCIEQALFDVQEIVITKAVECLTGLCQLGLFQKKISTLVEKARMTCSLLLHPSWWIRDAVLKLMGEIALQLRSVDANVFLSPLLRPFLRKTMVFLPDEEVSDVTRRLRDCCRLHVSRETFDRALLASSSSFGLNEVIAEMERSVLQAPDDSDDDMAPAAPLSAMTTTSRESLEEPISDMSKFRRNRDALLSTDSLDGYSISRQQSSGTTVASSAAATAETISSSVEDTMSSIYEQRKNEIQSLKLMQQYVSIASMQMRSKLEMAKTEQAARMQAPSKSDRVGSPHSSVANASVTAGSGAAGANSNPFARKLSRSHLRVLFVPDMRFALSTAQPLKASSLGITSSSLAASSNTASTSATSTSTALVTKSRSHGPSSSPSHRGGCATSASPNGVSATGAPSLESLSLSHVGKMYSLVEPSTPVSASPITVTGPSSVVPPGSVSSALEDSGLGQMDSNHFAPTSGGVMVSMLNMNMRDMYGGDGMSSLLDPHHHPVHASPVSPPRQRMIKKTHTTYHHYFAFKESAMDPALGNPRKLLARLNALGIPPLPPDLGALRLTDGTPYSIYSHAPSPYCLVGGGIGITGSSGVGGIGAPGSERGGTSFSSVTSSPIQVGSSTYPPSGSAAFNAAAAAATAINGHGGVSPGSFGNSSGSTAPGSSSSSVNGLGSGGGYPSSSYRNWQPRKNVLVAELAEHSGAVTRVNAAQDYSFLASASNDGTVKIWSVRSLQHSVNQGSRCTYDGQGGVITDMKVLTNSHSVASASSDGTVHVFRVDKVNAVGGNVQASGLKELRASNSAVMAIDYLNNVTEALLIYATRDGRIHAWDLRMRREAWTLSISPELGYVTCMTHSLDVSWFAVGTSRGFLCLWDLRFFVLIRIWRHSSHRAIHRLQPCLGLPNTLPLDETSVPLVFVAAGDGEVAVFDLSIGACRAVFRTLEAQATEAEACKCPTLLHVPIPHRSRSVLGSFLGIYGIATAFDEISTTPLSEEPSVRAMLCPSLHLRGIGDALITGGEDRQLRYWDIRNGKQSYTVCGNGEAKSFYDNQAPPNDWWRMNPSSSSSAAAPPTRFGEMPAAPMSTTADITKPEMAWSKLSPPLITVCQDSSFYSSPGGVGGAGASGAGGVESAISMERRGLVPPSPAHTDCILDLTLVELGSSQNPSPMLVSSGRDALIKVWK